VNGILLSDGCDEWNEDKGPEKKEISRVKGKRKKKKTRGKKRRENEKRRHKQFAQTLLGGQFTITSGSSVKSTDV